ncbi:hypothetical protein V6N11_017408 [Hibiscus sabdariffa]|uniref:Uncharacterized protein n=1 Tax=Hibiscus sabdariffa TaxID=183260 RepID=A0ABR2TY26_9ROSI
MEEWEFVTVTRSSTSSTGLDCRRGHSDVGGDVVGRQGRCVEGVIAEEKVVVLKTCALGWIKETVLIRVLAQEMAAARLDSFEVCGLWVAGSMVLSSFSGRKLEAVIVVS